MTDDEEDEVVTHGAELPTLPGIAARELNGASVATALAAVQRSSAPASV